MHKTNCLIQLILDLYHCLYAVFAVSTYLTNAILACFVHIMVYMYLISLHFVGLLLVHFTPL